MVRENKGYHCHQVLCADIRFSLPDVLNDHCWEIGSGRHQPSALSASTTFGLRAIRMRAFLSFTLEEHTVQDPAHFFTAPEIRFLSTNFISFSFSPFQGIDVVYQLWVPASQMIAGELLCSNRTDSTKALKVDWLVQLSPLESGSPMKHTQHGMTTVLQGECADLHPVFYLSGDITPSISDLPGLSSKYLLMPSASRQANWVLASMSSPDTSFQLARQYSSKSMDVEKLRIEMADKRDQAKIDSGQAMTSQALHLSRVRAIQLIMPPLANFKFPTFINYRNPDTGHHARSAQIETNPQWSGQSLPQIWMMEQILLPGHPELVRGFIMNMLTQRTSGGDLDHSVSVNGARTGYPALPMIAHLVADLHPYLNDIPWLEQIYPDLLNSLNSWLSIDPNGSKRVRGLSHPIQLGAQYANQAEAKLATNIWMQLKCDNNLLVTTLLIREVTDLLQISRWLGKSDEIEKLEELLKQLESRILSNWDEQASLFHHPGNSGDRATPGTGIHTYKRNGIYHPRRKLPSSANFFVRVSGEGYLPADFSCALTAIDDEVQLSFSLKPSDFAGLGDTRVFLSNKPISFVEAIEINNLPVGFSVEVGQPDFTTTDLFQLLGLHSGVLSPAQADRLLRTIRVRDYFTHNGLSLLPPNAGDLTLPAPAYLVGLIVEGLLRYGKNDLASRVFDHHFTDQLIRKTTTTNRITTATGISIDELTPARLFLNTRGLALFTKHEVILSHFIKRKQDAVTVQYNKIELKLKPYITEIHTQSGEVIYLNRAGPNRILID